MQAAIGRPILPRPITVTFAGGTIAAELVTGVPLLFLIELRIDAGAIGASRAAGQRFARDGAR
jgi:hypothetical protein